MMRGNQGRSGEGQRGNVYRGKSYYKATQREGAWYVGGQKVWRINQNE